MLRYFLLLTAGALLHAAKEDFMDVCINGTHQKTEPGPEDALHGQCAPWRLKSCCNSNTSAAAHQDQSFLYRFNWDHCGIMSEQCKRHFIQDTCFYECSPNLGPWIVTADQSWRKERIVDVPLCKEDCEAWYNDCSEDYTCKDNWHKGWNWTSGTNRCPQGALCRRFTAVFPSAKDFCEKVWTNSYKFSEAVRGSGRCMQLWFPNQNVTPNVRTAEYYAGLKGSAHSQRLALFTLLAPLLTLLAM